MSYEQEWLALADVLGIEGHTSPAKMVEMVQQALACKQQASALTPGQMAQWEAIERELSQPFIGEQRLISVRPADFRDLVAAARERDEALKQRDISDEAWQKAEADLLAARARWDAERARLREAIAVGCTCRAIEKCDRCEAIDALAGSPEGTPETCQEQR